MSREDFKIEFTRSFVRLAVIGLLVWDIARDNRVMWIWLAVRAAVLIEYISFSIKDGIKQLITNFLAHVATGAVMAYGWYGAYVLFDLKKKFFFENGAVLHATVPLCIKWCAILSAIGLTVSVLIYVFRDKGYESNRYQGYKGRKFKD